MIRANSGQKIVINGVFTPPVTEPEFPNTIVDDVRDVIADEVRDKDPLQEDTIVMQEPDADSDFNKLSAKFFTACSRNKQLGNSNECELEQAIMSFLGTLLIGGQLPDI